MINPPISVCIVCYNEEANIRACLESVRWVRDFGGEIIVVDSYSQDATVEICRRYTEKVYQERWRGYVAQKNYALSLAANDWILALDGDEAVSDQLREEIIKLWQNNASTKYVGFYIPRKTFYLGKWIRYGGWYPDRKLRLFRKSKGSWQGIDPHDKFVISNGKIGKLKHPIIHTNYRNISDQLRTINNFSTTAAEALLKRGKKFNLMKLIFGPPIKFFETYFFKLGFLDGLPGLVIAVNSAFYVFNKYAKMWEIKKDQKLSEK